MAGGTDGFEFQRLHGMGEALHEAVAESEPGAAWRIYAPVGGHRELLAYLVRRLLENGANSSFVAVVGDSDIPVERLLRRPAELLAGGDRVRHGRIPLPADLYAPARRNSRGMEFGDAAELGALTVGVDKAATQGLFAGPILAGIDAVGPARAVVSPVDGKTIGEVLDTPEDQVATIMVAAREGFAAWSRVPAVERAAALDRLADLLEADRDGLVALMAREGGRRSSMASPKCARRWTSAATTRRRRGCSSPTK